MWPTDLRDWPNIQHCWWIHGLHGSWSITFSDRSVNTRTLVAIDWSRSTIDLTELHRAVKLNWLNQCLSSLFLKRGSISALLLKASMISTFTTLFWPHAKYYALCHWNIINKLNNSAANKRWRFRQVAKCIITLCMIIRESYWKSAE